MTLIREFSANDLEAIHTINEASTPGVSSETPADLADIARMSCIALVAETAEKVVGFCLVLAPKAAYDSENYLWFSSHYDDFIYLDRVAVDPGFRSRGIGARLYDEVARRTKAAWFTLEVNLRPRNEGSLRFHRRRGFEEVGQQETRHDTLVSLMAKRLVS